jgi:hypothetical protein
MNCLINLDKKTKFANTHSKPFVVLGEGFRIHELRRPGNEKKVISAALEEIRGSFIYGPLWQEGWVSAHIKRALWN